MDGRSRNCKIRNQITDPAEGSFNWSGQRRKAQWCCHDFWSALELNRASVESKKFFCCFRWKVCSVLLSTVKCWEWQLAVLNINSRVDVLLPHRNIEGVWRGGFGVRVFPFPPFSLFCPAFSFFAHFMYPILLPILYFSSRRPLSLFTSFPSPPFFFYFLFLCPPFPLPSPSFYFFFCPCLPFKA